MPTPITPSDGDQPKVATPQVAGIAIPSSAEACASTGQPEASPPSTGSKPTPTTSSQPKLRSVPATTVAKKEPLLEAAPTIPASAVIDLDADWTDTSPLDHSSCMKGVLMSVGSPPNELETNDPVSSKMPSAAAAPSVRETPPQGLPVSRLRPIWQACATPLTNITTQYLQLDALQRRVDVSVLRATEVRGRNVGVDSQWCRGAKSRFVEVHKGYYSVPVDMKCDRTFIEHPGDAVYIEQMSDYLFSDVDALPPICTDARLYEVIVTSDKAKVQRHMLMWAILVTRGKVVSFEDFFVARKSVTDLSKASVQDSDTEPMLCIPWDLFPDVPKWLTESVDLRSAHVTPIRALSYFANTARTAGSTVFRRWNRALQIELAIHTAVAHFTAWARPVIDQARIWYPEKAHVKWLKGFEHLPPVPVYYESMGKHMMVSIRQVVTILEDTLARATPQSRKDYRTKTMVRFVPTPNSQIYVNDPLREAVLSPPSTTPVPVVTPKQVASSVPVKSSVTTPVSSKGVMVGRVIKRDTLKKNTRMTPEMLTALRGNGPWSVSEIIDHLVVSETRLTTINKGLTEELTQLRTETQRLREDINRYRSDAARLSDELRNNRDWNYNQLESRRYDDTNRGYGSRNPYDPYDRRY